ncbi:MAG: hypothetical protein M3Y05_10765 [Gemmatimonadota bacterium]|nr:hypothetical protein [Gemmatimonadota bacterium]
MAKLTFAVAALVALSLGGTRVQAQEGQQLATLDQPAVAQDAPVVAQEAPAVAAQDARAVAADAPVVAEEAPTIAPVDAQLDAQLIVADATPTIAQDPPVAADLSAPTGPSMDASTLSPRVQSHDALSANAMRRPSRGSGVGLMIFGGAALITGLIIGNNAGTVIAVGGALVGLYGLYVYLGRPTGMEQGSRIGLGYKLNTN